MKLSKNKLPLLIAIILLGVGLAYQNCGPQQNDGIRTNAFLDEIYTGPKEFSPKVQKQDSTEEPIAEKPAESIPEEKSSDKKTDVDVATTKQESEKIEPTGDEKKEGTSISTTSRRKIDPCRMDTDGDGVIEKQDQGLLYTMMQGMMTMQQVQQFDINNDGVLNQTDLLYYPGHVGEICQKLKQIVVNEQSTCAISKTGKVYCWGSHMHGQLGDGTMTAHLTPVEIDTSLLGIPNNFKDITAGLYYYCGVHDSGKIYCWGKNDGGTLGNGTTTDSTTPVEINMAGTGQNNDFKSVIAATHGDIMQPAHTCGIHTSGQVFCWGNNSNYEFGNGTNAGSTVPTVMNAAAFSSPIILSLSAGEDHTCVIDGNHKLYCWGNNYAGMLGIGSIVNQTVPMEVNTSGIGVTNDFKKVSASWGNTCAIHGNNKLYCWGSSYYGQVGNGSNVNQTLPVEVGFSSVGFANEIKDVDAGIQTTCAIDINNKGFCWGTNEWGQLGIGFMGNDYNLPQPIEDQPPEYASFQVVKAAHGRHACGIGTNKKAYCWVYGLSGQLGNGTTTLMSSHPMDLEVNVTNVQ